MASNETLHYIQGNGKSMNVSSNKSQFEGEFNIVELIHDKVEKCFEGRATSDWIKYCKFEIFQNEEDAVIFWLDGEYRNYDHFAGVSGKFDPYVAFFKNPPRAELTFEALLEITGKHNE